MTTPDLIGDEFPADGPVFVPVPVNTRAVAITPAQVADLGKPLMRSAVKQRQGSGGKSLNYLEGHFVKRTANEIFGYDGWSYTVDELICNGTEEFEKNGRTGWRVAYRAVVTLQVGAVKRGDVGHGDGISYSSRLEPHELAEKEAVTDALKRCWSSFGDRFGLVLYDKDRAA